MLASWRSATWSYLITLKMPGYRDVRYPVLLGRGAHHEADVTLYTEAEIGEGFVYVPGGPAIFGGDPEAYDPLTRQTASVAGFAIATFPVTIGSSWTTSTEAWRRRSPSERRTTSAGRRGWSSIEVPTVAGGLIVR